jgi:hypothetical protein
MFEYAGTIDSANCDSRTGRAFIDETLGQFVEWLSWSDREMATAEPRTSRYELNAPELLVV